MYSSQESTKGLFSWFNSRDDLESLYFQFNPTTIKERRSVEYNFSKAQGQLFSQSQFGMIGNTELTFKLFFHHAKKVSITVLDSVKLLRQLTLPLGVNRLTHYSQIQPPVLELDLGGIGVFNGVIKDLEFNYIQYDKKTLQPLHVEVDVTFICTSKGFKEDNNHIKSIVT